MRLPDTFVERINKKLQDDGPLLIQSLDDDPLVSIRYHGKKSNPDTDNEKVKWCKNGYYLSQRAVFTLDPEFHAGAYYVQEASSMFLWTVLEQLELPKGLLALDLCAAPGGKSTLIADFLNEKGFLLANEVIKSRSEILKQNMEKWAYANVAISNNDPKAFKHLENLFDLVVVDAPCSGEGLFRKDERARTEWSEKNVALCSSRQKRIIADVVKSLKPGGFLIYSTCTYNDDENINNCIWMAREEELESIILNIPSEWGITLVSKENMTGYQFYPYKTKGEGFFISVLKKKGVPKPTKFAKIKTFEYVPLAKSERVIVSKWIKEDDTLSIVKDSKGSLHLITSDSDKMKLLSLLGKHLYLKTFGIEIGKLKNDVFIPSHALALSLYVKKSIPRLELSKRDALLFMKKEKFEIKTMAKGWYLVTYNDSGLGWIKHLGNRINNYFPSELRIRMAIT